MLRGITADTVSADIVRMNVKLAEGSELVPITCAVCNTLSHPLILGSDVVSRLHSQLLFDRSRSSETSDVDSLVDHVDSCIDANAGNIAVGSNQTDEAVDDVDEDVVNVDDVVDTSHSECNESANFL